MNETGRRAVLLVANAAAPYSRATRLARTLAQAGWRVEIAAIDEGRDPLQGIDADGVATRRYRPRGPWARFARAAARPRGLPGRLVEMVAKLVAWPVHVRGWWAALDAELGDADLYHAFGILAIPVALALARRARRRGRQAVVVYDVIDVILESNNVDRIPAPAVAWYRWRERRWARAAGAVVTVNDAIAAHLRRIWPLGSRPVVLLNCQPRWDPPATGPDHIRTAAGLTPDWRVVLFLGRLGPQRGLDESAEAVLRLPRTSLVAIGFGAWADRMKARDADPEHVRRHVTLPPVPPDDVVPWASSADASVIAVPANSLNQRLSSPNKFWESLTAGVPIVVGHDLEVMRAIVERHDIGVAADPADPAAIARALSALLDAPPDVRAARRKRCLALGRDTYNWETAVEPYLELISTLGG